MSGFTLVVGIIVGLGVIVAALLLPARWIAHGYPQARTTLTRTRRVLQDGGVNSPEGRAVDQELADLVRDLRDRRLQRHVEAVLEEYRDAWASHPGPFFVLGADVMNPDSDHSRMTKLHEEHVRSGLEEIERSLDWMRKFERVLLLHPKS